jgi:hypothetical protein
VEINLVQEQLLIAGAAFTHPISDGRAFCGEPIKAGRPTGFRNLYDAALACDTRRFNNDWYRKGEDCRAPDCDLRSLMKEKFPCLPSAPQYFVQKTAVDVQKTAFDAVDDLRVHLLDKKGVGVSIKKA